MGASWRDEIHARQKRLSPVSRAKSNEPTKSAEETNKEIKRAYFKEQSSYSTTARKKGAQLRMF